MKIMYDAQYFRDVLSNTKGYFAFEYEGGTREMIHRYVCRKMGFVPPLMVSAALKILKIEGSIVYEKKVWWNTGNL